MKLLPMYLYLAEQSDNFEMMERYHLTDCIECGACTYTCPARLPLTHAFRMGKQQVNNARMAAKALADAEKTQTAKKEA